MSIITIQVGVALSSTKPSALRQVAGDSALPFKVEELKKPIKSKFPLFKNSLKFEKGEYAAFKLRKEGNDKDAMLDGFSLLNANLSFAEQFIKDGDFITLIPLSYLQNNITLGSLKKIKHSGFVTKSSKKGGSESFSNPQKRWAVIQENLLFYFLDKKESSKPKGVVNVEVMRVEPSTEGSTRATGTVIDKTNNALKLFKSTISISDTPLEFIIKPQVISSTVRSSTLEDVDADLLKWYKTILSHSAEGCKHRQFGVPLISLWIRYDEHLPPIINDLFEVLPSKDYENAEGAFRISGNRTLIDVHRESYESGKPKSWDSVDVHSALNILKEFLRELPTPLMPYEFYSHCLSLSNNPIDFVDIVNQILSKLPLPNVILLKKTLEICLSIARNEKITKMSFENVAICVAVNVLRPETESSAEVMLNAGKVSQSFILMMKRQGEFNWPIPDNKNNNHSSPNVPRKINENLPTSNSTGSLGTNRSGMNPLANPMVQQSTRDSVRKDPLSLGGMSPLWGNIPAKSTSSLKPHTGISPNNLKPSMKSPMKPQGPNLKQTNPLKQGLKSQLKPQLKVAAKPAFNPQLKPQHVIPNSNSQENVLSKPPIKTQPSLQPQGLSVPSSNVIPNSSSQENVLSKPPIKTQPSLQPQGLSVPSSNEIPAFTQDVENLRQENNDLLEKNQHVQMENQRLIKLNQELGKGQTENNSLREMISRLKQEKEELEERTSNLNQQLQMGNQSEEEVQKLSQQLILEQQRNRSLQQINDRQQKEIEQLQNLAVSQSQPSNEKQPPLNQEKLQRYAKLLSYYETKFGELPEEDQIFCICSKTYSEDSSAMVECSGTNCLFKWFHFSCMNISQEDTQQGWFCTDCKTQQQN